MFARTAFRTTRLASQSRLAPAAARLLSVSKSRAKSAPQSISPLAPIGVAAAYEAASSPSYGEIQPKIFDEFSLKDRVGIVSGGNRGLGLEMALALCEAGARAVYCLDLPKQPSEDWTITRDFVAKMGIGSRLEYINVNVTNQKEVWGVGDWIAAKEGRMDFCVAAAGVLKPNTDCLEYDGAEFKEVKRTLAIFIRWIDNSADC
jgi:hypothetical protein